jgi:hypothetical protein
MRSGRLGLFAMVAIVSLLTAWAGSASSSQTHGRTGGMIADPMRAPSLPTAGLLASHLAQSIVRSPGTSDLSLPPNAADGTVNRVGPWNLNATADDKRYLLIYAPTNGCYALWRVRVAETKSSVVITPELSLPKHAFSCPSVGINRLLMIDLGSRLGDRTLLHPRVTANLTPPAIKVEKG